MAEDCYPLDALASEIEAELAPLLPEGLTVSISRPCASEDDHCTHWWDCEPCCRCGDDTEPESCDCPRHAKVTP